MAINYKAHVDADGKVEFYVESGVGDTRTTADPTTDLVPGLQQTTSNDGSSSETLPGVHTHVKSDITDFSDSDYATAAQGAAADTAVQPGDLATVATTGSYNDLSDQPTIPPAAPVDSVNGQTGVVVVTATDVGLGNVDNTSDADKPVSTAQAAADTALQGQITSNDTDIATNTAAVALNTAATAANASDIATVQADQLTQDGNISANASAITTIQGEQTTQDAAIALNTAKVSADGSIDTHSDVDTTTTAPTNGQVLAWDGANFVPQTVAGGSGQWLTNANGINYSSGNVGIDTVLPDRNLQIGSPVNDSPVQDARLEDAEIAMYSGTATNNGTSTLGLYESVPGAFPGDYGARIRYDAATNLLEFVTVAAGVETNAFTFDRATQTATFTGPVKGIAAVADDDFPTFLQIQELNDAVKVSNVALANVNNAGTFASFTTTDLLGSTLGQFTLAANGITPNFTGVVDIVFNINMTSTVQRPNVGFRWLHNGAVGPWVQHSYIRSTGGHNESSANLSSTINVVAGQAIQIGHQNFAAGGTVVVPANTVEFIIRRRS